MVSDVLKQRNQIAYGSFTPAFRIYSGAFGIKRTKSNFSSSSGDLTLEQTINADTNNQLVKIFSADSIPARQRWVLSHSMRTKILTAVEQNIGCAKKMILLIFYKKVEWKKAEKSFHKNNGNY